MFHCAPAIVILGSYCVGIVAKGSGPTTRDPFHSGSAVAHVAKGSGPTTPLS